MPNQNLKSSRWYSGRPPSRDGKTVYVVQTTENNKFVFVGEVTVTDLEVHEAMEAHMSIKGYEWDDIAKKKAKEKYIDINPALIMPKKYWIEKYGEIPTAKRKFFRYVCQRCKRIVEGIAHVSPDEDLCMGCYLK